MKYDVVMKREQYILVTVESDMPLNALQLETAAHDVLEALEERDWTTQDARVVWDLSDEPSCIETPDDLVHHVAELTAEVRVLTVRLASLEAERV